MNARPLDHRGRLLPARGYNAHDFLRPFIFRTTRAEPFYRYDTLLDVNATGATSLSADILATRLSDSHPVREYAPWH
jgi:hypothetical protein